jgi:1-acyl-sn-glycerol-3-phosphate acyltransferase
MKKLRSLLCEILIYLFGILIPIIYCFVFITNSSKYADKGALIWSKFSLFVLKVICGVTYEIRGLENIPKNKSCIIACKHQSMWETIVMHVIFPRPAYTFKKELTNIPFYGWFIQRMTGIKIDREGGIRSLKKLVQDSKRILEEGHNIILFPQGTRVPVGASSADYNYKPGVKALYSQLNFPIIPTALNSGKYYPKNIFGKKKGKIILEFLPQIDPETSRQDFLAVLEKSIEENSKKLL